MSTPGAMQESQFKQISTEVAGWLWGTVQGAWNEKQTVSQIMVDAVIGMIPLVGQGTAVRDLLAVGSGLAENPEKRAETWQWVLLVVLLLALIPVFGGVLKGVGRLTLRAAKESAQDSAKLAAMADDMVAFLNRMGHKDAVQWLRKLDFAQYEAQLVERCKAFCNTVILSIHRYAFKFQKVLPNNLALRMQSMAAGFEQVKLAADHMIPRAVKELNESLKKIQAHLIAGGVPPIERAVVYEAQTGQKVVTYAQEARLIESGAAKAVVHAGKFPQNLAVNTDEIGKVYRHEVGFPDLLERAAEKTITRPNGQATKVKYYPAVASASGKIGNVDLGEKGAVLFRAFGPEGSTHGVKVKASEPVSFWWGLSEAPKTAQEWRQMYAVLDEWNRNGMVSIVRIPAGGKVKAPACASTVSEQFGDKIVGQFLEGGGKQAAIDFSKAADLADVSRTMTDLLAKGGGKTTLSNGIQIEVRHSGWGGINGKIGYGAEVIPGAGIVERLGVTEMQTKISQAGVQQGVQAAGSSSAGVAKDQRAAPNRTH